MRSRALFPEMASCEMSLNDNAGAGPASVTGMVELNARARNASGFGGAVCSQRFNQPSAVVLSNGVPWSIYDCESKFENEELI